MLDDIYIQILKHMKRSKENIVVRLVKINDLSESVIKHKCLKFDRLQNYKDA